MRFCLSSRVNEVENSERVRSGSVHEVEGGGDSAGASPWGKKQAFNVLFQLTTNAEEEGVKVMQ